MGFREKLNVEEIRRDCHASTVNNGVPTVTVGSPAVISGVAGHAMVPPAGGVGHAEDTARLSSSVDGDACPKVLSSGGGARCGDAHGLRQSAAW